MMKAGGNDGGEEEYAFALTPSLLLTVALVVVGAMGDSGRLILRQNSTIIVKVTNQEPRLVWRGGEGEGG